MLNLHTFFFIPSSLFYLAATTCKLCARLLQDTPQALTMLFLCRHVVHASCVNGAENLPVMSTPFSTFLSLNGGAARGLSGSIAL